MTVSLENTEVNLLGPASTRYPTARAASAAESTYRKVLFCTLDRHALTR
jgi:hypothetical protein